MRYFIIFLLCITSVCLAQENYHDDEFSFNFEVPSGWNISFENEWPDKLKAALERAYATKTLLLLTPSDRKPSEMPLIQIQGKELKRTTTYEEIESIKKKHSKDMISSAEYTALAKLGLKRKQYRQIDTFYNYDSSRKFAIAKILYQHRNEDVYFLSAIAKFIGLQRVIDFRGYWRGEDPEEFWQVFNKVTDSFEYDKDAAAPFSSSFEGRNLSEKMLNKVIKWGGIILTISIILGLVKMSLGR